MTLSGGLRATFAAIYTDAMRMIASLHAAALASSIHGVVTPAAALEAPSNCSADGASYICRIINPDMRGESTGYRLLPGASNERGPLDTAQLAFAMPPNLPTRPRLPG
ncbi:hypothetical protein [Sphingopyxis sp. JAI128]|uniref:hypothetical protein n=1 Tax=Sphingopyxis sp. JAI128 TaxID=2723066 RepID=UPI001609A735|nr:hypothetical protein [Sphingopyxis sp. JAI128]MBB6426891.1 hypothetical protein [Sphingopyxis sp. JAI128]